MHSNPKAMRATLPRRITAQQVRAALEEGREVIAHSQRLLSVDGHKRTPTPKAREVIAGERIDREVMV